MQHNSSAMPIGSETWERRRAMESDDELEASVAEIVQSGIAHNSMSDAIAPSPGSIVMDGVPTPQLSYRQIEPIGYAPLAIRGADLPIVEGSLNVEFSSGGDIAPFHGEYLSSAQELLRQIGSASLPEDFASIPAPSRVAQPKRQYYLSKLQLGGVAAACVLVGAGIYVGYNPQILAPLTTASATIAPSTTSSNLGQLIQSPNLAANEFTKLNLSSIDTIAASLRSGSNASSANDRAKNQPVAIRYDPTSSVAIPPRGNTARVKLSDSLVKSLLPANFSSSVKPIDRNQRVGVKP